MVLNMLVRLPRLYRQIKVSKKQYYMLSFGIKYSMRDPLCEVSYSSLSATLCYLRGSQSLTDVSGTLLHHSLEYFEIPLDYSLR